MVKQRTDSIRSRTCARSQLAWWIRSSVALGCLCLVSSCATSEPSVQHSLERTWLSHKYEDGAQYTLTLAGFSSHVPEQSFDDPLSYQLTYVDLRGGLHVGSSNEYVSRAALSLIKLYIAQYVIQHGDADEQAEALTMIRNSDDDIATELYAKYPTAIESIATQYHLTGTVADPRWGYSLSSTYDVAFFLAQLMREDYDSPVLVAMRETDAVAKDGTSQDYGTAVLPGVVGTKFAWSNDKDLFATASYGHDFIVVASNYGSAEDLTHLVEQQFMHVPTSTRVRPVPTSTRVRPVPTSTSVRPVPTSTSVRPVPTSTSVRPVPSSTSARPASGSTKARPSPTTAGRK
ncbi:hypothetical protein [Corynebacterium sp. HS2168-gen11]|uniref:hypothetical protein n=1 Tax=Corynebacterium sp. HS2168-gen11 TaxID=2974027 RepID=UPI00216B24CB|nr:hypothetical protein [Corynebacterium sp. HS2168-gen11]MCS4536448.1 hypothetical protein [Corynebacterium sp. HS2168-gen11]